MRSTARPTLGSAILMLSLALAAVSSAWADGPLLPRQVPTSYRAECGSCHTAYPPALLPAASWQRVMRGLDRHYGTDASLDAPTLRELSAWLQQHAGTYKRVDVSPPEDRITRSAWFARKHRDVQPSDWRHPSVKSPANCAACHSRADQGRFDDDELRMPAGLTASRRRTESR